MDATVTLVVRNRCDLHVVMGWCAAHAGRSAFWKTGEWAWADDLQRSALVVSTRNLDFLAPTPSAEPIDDTNAAG